MKTRRLVSHSRIVLVVVVAAVLVLIWLPWQFYPLVLALLAYGLYHIVLLFRPSSDDPKPAGKPTVLGPGSADNLSTPQVPSDARASRRSNE